MDQDNRSVLLHKFVIMGPDIVKIFTEGNPPRLGYIAGIILGDILGLKWQLVSDRRKLGKHYVINYSGENIPGAFRIRPDTLLFETGIRSREINISNWRNLPVFFQTKSDSDIPFDIFAASFFLVSRYEEYQEFNPDEYGRFKAAGSVAFRNHFLTRPVIDLWAREFARSLLKKFQTLAFRRNQFRALMTIDADEPFAYLGRSLAENISAFFHDISKKTGQASDRYGCITGKDKDPYDVFDYIIDEAGHFSCNAGFFFPVGDISHFDRNPDWRHPLYRKLISGIPPKYFTGIHPSYYSPDNEVLLTDEIARLRSIINRDVTESRFHYLRIRFPGTYRNLIRAGIFSDYSMGYSEETGFRAGIARPFFFYDVIADEQTPLKITPFQIMDLTLLETKGLNIDDAGAEIKTILNEVAGVGGTFVTIWHNTSLLDNDKCRNRRELFKITLECQRRAEEMNRI